MLASSERCDVRRGALPPPRVRSRHGRNRSAHEAASCSAALAPTPTVIARTSAHSVAPVALSRCTPGPSAVTANPHSRAARTRPMLSIVAHGAIPSLLALGLTGVARDGGNGTRRRVRARSRRPDLVTNRLAPHASISRMDSTWHRRAPASDPQVEDVPQPDALRRGRATRGPLVSSRERPGIGRSDGFCDDRHWHFFPPFGAVCPVSTLYRGPVVWR